MELSNVSWSRSILNMAECSQRKLVTALSQHVTYGKAVVTHHMYVTESIHIRRFCHQISLTVPV